MLNEVFFHVLCKNITEVLPRRKPEDGLIDWNQSASTIYNFVRGLTHPYPGAFSYLSGTKYFIWKSALILGELEHSFTPGSVVSDSISTCNEACGIIVACKIGFFNFT